MNNSYTYSQSKSNSYSETNATYVNDKIFENFQALAFAGLISNEKAEKWADDLLFIMNKEALAFFQLQFRIPPDSYKYIEYRLIADGSINIDNASGGINYQNLPTGTTVSLYAELNEQATTYSDVLEELRVNRGWGTGSSFKEEGSSYNKSFSKDGYGVEIHTSKNWD